MPSEYRIRFPDGTFSTGGQCPRSSKKGKSWRNIGHVKAHLQGLSRPNIYDRTTLVRFEVTVTEEEVTSMDALRAEIETSKREKRAEFDEWLQKIKEGNDRAKLAALKIRYPDEGAE